MIVDVKNEDIVCIADDWKALQDNERKFLSQCYFNGVWTHFDDGGRLVMRKEDDAARQEKIIHAMGYAAEQNNIKVSEGVADLLLIVKEKQKKEEERRIAEKIIEMKRSSWEYRQKRGCEGCRMCKVVGDASFVCGYSGDDLDCRFAEVWNLELKMMDIFHEVGVPNEHCKDYFGERIGRKS